MPSCVAIGMNIGVKINTAGVKSINIPTMSKMMFIKIKIMIGLSEIDSIHSLIMLGNPVNAIAQDIMVEAPIKNSMIPVISAVGHEIDFKVGSDDWAEEIVCFLQIQFPKK